MTFAERLASLMTRSGLSTSGIARKLGISRQSVAYWLSGRNKPSEKMVDRLATLFSVSSVWLLTGNDDIRLQPVVSADHEQQDSGYIFVPEYELEFACGDGNEPPAWIETEGGSSAAYKPEFFQKRHINPNRCKRVKADGDSMEPLICDGDSVLFVEMREGEPIRDGRIYALSYGGALKIKRLYRKANGDLVIRSENSDRYADEIVPNDELDNLVRIYGEVIERSGSI